MNYTLLAEVASGRHLKSLWRMCLKHGYLVRKVLASPYAGIPVDFGQTSGTPSVVYGTLARDQKAPTSLMGFRLP